MASDLSAAPAHPWLAPWSSRTTIRLVLVREIERERPAGEDPTPIADVLQFGRLAPHVRRHQALLPQCISVATIPPEDVRWNRVDGRLDTNRAIHSIWTMPGADTDFSVQLVDITPADGVSDLVAALEDMYYGDLAFDTADTATTPQGGRTHQMVVFSEPGERELSADEIQRLIYRADMPAREEYSSISRPAELNRRPGRGAALGPFVSVLWGQQDYIENCAFLSVVVGTAAASVIADARHRLLVEIAKIGQDIEHASAARPTLDIQRTRSRLEDVNRVVARTENRIALCIDGLSTLMPYIPALRVESYHRALFAALDTEGNRTALERLLLRLTELVRVEQAALESHVASRAEARSKRWSLSVGIASALAIPFGIIFGFFGIGAAEVDPAESIFSARYVPLFSIVSALMLAIVGLHYTMYRLDRSRQGQQRRRETAEQASAPRRSVPDAEASPDSSERSTDSEPEERTPENGPSAEEPGPPNGDTSEVEPPLPTPPSTTRAGPSQQPEHPAKEP